VPTIHREWKVLFRLLTINLASNLMKYLLLGDKEKVLSIFKGTIDYFLRKTGKSSWAHKQ
jgi:hypothetical protein